jgi:hypothetical protein
VNAVTHGEGLDAFYRPKEGLKAFYRPEEGEEGLGCEGE